MAKKKVAAKPPTKSEILGTIADKTDLTRKQVSAVLEELSTLIGKNLKRSPQMFTVPGLCKIVVKKTKSIPAGERVNPFTGEKKWMPAKPARNTVKVRPLKALKDMV